MHTIIDNYFHELHAEGVGAEVKHTSIISNEEEDRLWEEGILGVNTPEALLHALFYLSGQNFCLRGGKEHCAPKVSQIVRHDNPVHYVYQWRIQGNFVWFV